jgi:hypothetical protein
MGLSRLLCWKKAEVKISWQSPFKVSCSHQPSQNESMDISRITLDEWLHREMKNAYIVTQAFNLTFSSCTVHINWCVTQEVIYILCRVLARSRFWCFAQVLFSCWPACWQVWWPSVQLMQCSRECTPPCNTSSLKYQKEGWVIILCSQPRGCLQYTTYEPCWPGSLYCIYW